MKTKINFKYDSRLSDYFQGLSDATEVDKVKLIRMAMAVAPHTQEFQRKIAPYLINSNVGIEWSLDHDKMWMLTDVPSLIEEDDMSRLIVKIGGIPKEAKLREDTGEASA